VLNAGTKTAILAGAGALHARDELLAAAELLGAPIVKTLPGKAAVPDDSPYTTGGIGLLGTRPSERLMEEIDTLFMVGTNFPYTKHLPAPDKVRTVQIEADPVRAGGRMPTEMPVVGDAKEGLQALLPLLHRREDRSFLESCQQDMERWRAEMASLQNVERDPIAPQYLMSLVDRYATNDAILTCDSGTIATWAARHWTIRGGRGFYLSGNLATMAPGLPYAIAAQLAYPERQCIAFVGDGGFAMLMAEFLTAARHGLPIKVIINNNGAYGQILWEQVALGYPEYGVRHEDSKVVQGFADYTGWARSCGGYAAKVTVPGELDEVVREALAHPGPALVDCNVNPNEPPMPGKIEYGQAKGFTEAFLRGQPHKAGIVRTLAADTVEKLRS
jgi:pyruvate dehydrogenase (quinone)/pyruvate oxidase